MEPETLALALSRSQPLWVSQRRPCNLRCCVCLSLSVCVSLPLSLCVRVCVYVYLLKQ